VAQILAWADDWFERTGGWPHATSGPIPETLDETWGSVDRGLRRATRGVHPPTSLARLLAEHRGVRNPRGLPPFTVEQILAWADAYHQASGAWPSGKSGPIAQAPGETWGAVDAALREGARGLPGGSSLAQVLVQHWGMRHPLYPPGLTVEQILGWADAHREATGLWPSYLSGAVGQAPGETWCAVDSALREGARGMPGGSTLARLLAQHRGVRNPKGLPPLTTRQVLAWANAHHRRTGRWPTRLDGPVAGAPPGTTWMGVDAALNQGLRGLPGGSTLSRLLAKRRSAAPARQGDNRGRRESAPGR
jgi:hypothetical protein